MSYSAGSFIRRAFISGSVLTLGFGVAAGAETIVSTTVVVPQTIQISPELQPDIDSMLQLSATFRRQFERMAGAPMLLVSARVDPTFTQRAFRARSIIRRYHSGLLVVAVEIGPGRRQAEWIAHEFEHVLEHLDGLTLSDLADRRQSGVWYSGEAMIETVRAIRAGRAVLGEMAVRQDDPTSVLSR